jgi:hypothetical protein
VVSIICQALPKTTNTTTNTNTTSNGRAADVAASADPPLK